jgi:hypothetical protein
MLSRKTSSLTKVSQLEVESMRSEQVDVIVPQWKMAGTPNRPLPTPHPRAN